MKLIPNKKDVYCFTTSLRQILSRKNIALNNGIKRALDNYIAKWTKAAPVKSQEANAGRALSLQLMADLHLESWREIFEVDSQYKIQCRDGCSHCCRMRTAITASEADLLVLRADKMKLPLSPISLERQASYGDDDDWAKQTPEDRACVFLGEDQRCRVYDVRPLSCRKHFVATEPELCDLATHAGGQVGVLCDIDVEILSTAAMTYFGAGQMPNMLLEAMRRKERTERLKGEGVEA